MPNSIDYGNKAIEFIEHYKLDAEPDIYKIIYDYFSGENPLLNSPIDERINNDKPVTVSFIDDLKQRYYNNDDDTIISDVSEKVGSEIDEVTRILSDSITSFEGYESNILEGIEELKETQSGSDITKIIKKLVTYNEKIVLKTRDMEDNLKESKKQIEDLNVKLTDTKKQAYTDGLTQIPNRLHFNQVLEQEVKEALENNASLCLIIGDIDYFKKFNDTFGHPVGDQVLRFVAYILKKSVKGKDFCARYGGEEFVILLPDTELKNAISVANSIRETIQQKELRRKSTNETLGNITMSMGISLLKHGENVEEFLARADACLYLAKDAGRNNVKTEIDMNNNTQFAS